MESHGILKALKSTEPVYGALTIRPNIPEIPGEEANRTVFFPEFHSDILGVPREVGLKFRKIGITGKFRSIRSFLLGPLSPSSEIELNMAASSFSCFYLIVLLDTIVMEWPQQALVSSAKIHVLACLSVFFSTAQVTFRQQDTKLRLKRLQERPGYVHRYKCAQLHMRTW